jgi:hypothetical protein
MHADLIESFSRKLREGQLTIEESNVYFESLYANGSMGRFDNELHVEDLLSDFESHLHLDVHRFPPQGIISKSRLHPDRAEHQPWLKLVQEDFDHEFYDDPKKALERILSGNRLTNELVERIESACENDKLARDWSDLSKELDDAGLSDAEVRSLHEDLNRTFDLPPLLAVTRGMRQVGISYALAKRKHATTVFRPDCHGKTAEEEEFSSFDIELVLVDKNSVAHSIHDLGSGVRAVLPVIVALSTAEVGLLSIEEPECHVHPRLQAEMGDLLVRRTGWTYYDGPMEGYQYQERSNWEHRRKSNMIVETHSEHLILRILRRIRETTENDFSDWSEELKRACPNGIHAEELAVLYVEAGVEEAGAKVVELPVTDAGDFTKTWPDGFFEERFDEYE